jgi:hypothetical protein
LGIEDGDEHERQGDQRGGGEHRSVRLTHLYSLIPL